MIYGIVYAVGCLVTAALVGAFIAAERRENGWADEDYIGAGFAIVIWPLLLLLSVVAIPIGMAWLSEKLWERRWRGK
jgi:hypothetical protein